MSFYNHPSPYKSVTIKIKEFVIEKPNSEKILGVTIDSKLSLDDNITTQCRKTSQKIHALIIQGSELYEF